MEPLERNHKATARGKEQPESWVGRYKLLPSPLVGRWQTMCIDMETQDTKTFHKAVGGGESSNVTGNGKSMCCNQWQEWKITKWLWVSPSFIWNRCRGWAVGKKKIKVRKLTLSSFAGVVNQNVRFNTFRVLRGAEWSWIETTHRAINNARYKSWHFSLDVNAECLSAGKWHADKNG